MQLKEHLEQLTREHFGLTPDQCSDRQLYEALLLITRRMAQERPAPNTGRKLYYFSAEFLVGKLLSNNLLALGIHEEARKLLSDLGRDLGIIESMEPEPSLGNGGLGRLAACFLDSIAALGLPGDGVGLNYHYGLFQQRFEGNKQQEEPNPWMEADSWLIPTGKTFTVPFGAMDLKAVLYDIAVPGANNGYANRLHLFDLEQPAPQPWLGIGFDKTDIAHNLTSFLYPDDSDEAGRLLRVYQQYFMVSAGAQLILQELEERGYALNTLADHVVVQINDTHPSMVIPELIRLLTARGLSMDEAIDQVSRTCAYTNHTILAEALEKWPRHYLDRIVPQLMPIIEKLDKTARSRTQDESTAIIDKWNTVHMAHMDIHFSHSVNGVAALHSQILKDSELKNFSSLYPEKFNNKTNGITFRRWLLKCNPELTAEIEDRIGSGFRKDANELEKLMDYSDDVAFLARYAAIKAGNKAALAEWLHKTQNVTINPMAMFSIQSKRLHEYKRQQLNLLFLIHQYFKIKAGHKPAVPLLSLFGAKAAPAYTIAKDIIHALRVLSKVIENDPEVAPWLQVVFVENYNVTAAEKMIPACDLSEQISLASKEASGTGNMKFMLNGAVTLGTLDGANVEIAQQVGNDSIYIFGASSNQVIHRYAKGDYCAWEWVQADPNLKRAIDFLTGKEMLKYGQAENLHRLKNELIHKDWFQTLPDFNAYVVRKNQAMADYACDPIGWLKKCLMNTAKAGFFSSDRTIAEYNRDIWKL